MKILNQIFGKWKISLALLIALCWALALPSCQRAERPVKIVKTPTTKEQGGNPTSDAAPVPQSSKGKKNAAPDYAWQVLETVRRTGEAPEGYVGGRIFQNREKRLPQKEGSGKKIQYQEWDVHPKIRGQNRGAERLVTGSDGTAWFTNDHYRTFIKME